MATKIRVKKGDSIKLTEEETSKIKASQAESLERMKKTYPEVTSKGIRTTPKGEHIWYKNEGGKYNSSESKIEPSDTLPQKKLNPEEWKKEAIKYANAKK